MLKEQEMQTLKQIAKGVAEQFGSNCEVVIHEITEKSAYSSIELQWREDQISSTILLESNATWRE